MADQITNCETFKDGATIKYHEVYYTLDNGKTFRIHIDANDMTDSSDTAELKTLANTKATSFKTKLAITPYTYTPDSTINGNVTL